MKQAFEGYQLPVKKKATAYHWQDSAAKVCQALKVPVERKAAIFKAFRVDYSKATTAYRNMVGKKYKQPWEYFLKLVNL